MKRKLYLAAYDISNASRLRAALYAIKGFASGGQKSVFECFLAPDERDELVETINYIIDQDEDRFLLLPLGPANAIETLGKGVAPVDPSYYYIG